MRRLRAGLAALLLVSAPLAASAQAPEQSLEQIEPPPGMMRWAEILSVLVSDIASETGVSMFADDEAEAAALRHQAAQWRAGTEQRLAELRVAIDSDREADAETLAQQRLTLERIDALARFNERARLEIISDENNYESASRQILFATFLEVSLLQANMAASMEDFLPPGSFQFAWNRAFEISQRVSALDLQYRLSLLRGESDLAGAQAGMAALAAQCRALAMLFAEAAELTAYQRAGFSEATVAHAAALEGHAARWAELTVAHLLDEIDEEDPPALIVDLAALAPPSSAPL